MTIPRRKRVTFLARTKRKRRSSGETRDEYGRRAGGGKAIGVECCTKMFTTYAAARRHEKKHKFQQRQRRQLKAINKRRRKRGQPQLSFFGITAKDLNMNPNRRD